MAARKKRVAPPVAGRWMQTWSGRKIEPLLPTASDISIEDIAHALSQICRWGGHTKSFYSVAQHSMLVASAVSTPALRKAALLHDAAEAYMGDIVLPLKRDAKLGDATWSEAEGRLLHVIFLTLGVAWPSAAGWRQIKKADERVLLTEARDLMSPVHPDWPEFWRDPLPHLIRPLSCVLAANEFYTTWLRLCGVSGPTTDTAAPEAEAAIDPERRIDMARKKKDSIDDQDREFLDTAGAPPSILEQQAAADRDDAQSKHLARGLSETNDTLKIMSKAVAHGLATDNRDVKESCLKEAATLAEHITYESRRAVRDAAAENRNLQE